MNEEAKAMQVWIVNHYGCPPNEAGGTRHFALAKSMLSRGLRSTIICSSFSHQSGLEQQGICRVSSLESFEGVPFYRLWTGGALLNLRFRIVGMLFFTLRAILLAAFRSRRVPRPDIVVGTSVHPFAAFAGWVLARRFRVPFVLEVRDLWPETLIEMGATKRNSLAAKLLFCLEKFLFERARFVISPLPAVDKYIADRGYTARFEWIPNGIDYRQFLRCQSQASDVDCESEFRFVYAGSLGPANDLQTILSAFELFSERCSNEVALEIYGAGPLSIELANWCKARDLPVCFHGAVPKEEVAVVVSNATALVISVLDRPGLYKYGISMNKLFDYMASGRPIVISSSAVNNPVESAGAGVSVPAGDWNALAGAMWSLYQLDPQERSKLGRRGIEFVKEHHDFQAIGSRLADLLFSLCADSDKELLN